MLKDDQITPGHPDYWDAFYEEGEGSSGRYEWFMDFENYEDLVEEAVGTAQKNLRKDTFFLLHVGAGNSDFCDHMATSFPNVDVTNTDICAGVVADMREQFPQRKYLVADCCDMAKEVAPASVDILFDKGTLDALLSAFPDQPGENPNAQQYIEEVHRVLAVGGVALFLTINDPSNVMQYFYSAGDFEVDTRVMVLENLSRKNQVAKEVRRMGRQYNVYFAVKQAATGAAE